MANLFKTKKSERENNMNTLNKINYHNKFIVIDSMNNSGKSDYNIIYKNQIIGTNLIFDSALHYYILYIITLNHKEIKFGLKITENIENLLKSFSNWYDNF
jgi:hypothetical protein